jgi:hypothetical protein
MKLAPGARARAPDSRPNAALGGRATPIPGTGVSEVTKSVNGMEKKRQATD